MLDASLWVGYVWADEPRSGASVVVTGTSAAALTAEAGTIARRFWDARHAFDFVAPAGPADWCLDRAARLAGAGERAIFISDSGDNPTAGGVGDVPYFLGRLLAHPHFGGRRAAAPIYASIPDPARGRSVPPRRARRRRPPLARAASSTRCTAGPLTLRGTVTALLRDDPVGGDIAAVRSGGVHAVVTSRRKPYHHVRDLLALGLDPAAHHVTAVKIGYLVPDLRRRPARPARPHPRGGRPGHPGLTYRRVPRPVFPLDPAMAWEPDVRLFGDQ